MSGLHYYPFFCPKQNLWYIESLEEIGKLPLKRYYDYNYSVFPKRFYKYCANLPDNKKYDYCFIGSFLVDKPTSINRSWILKFINNKFTNNSFLQFTDKKTKKGYIPMGSYDYTLIKKGFVPKEVPLKKRNYFDKEYYKHMKESQFTLCPAGDSFFSMRFQEAIMCKSIPIVQSYDETFRSKSESLLPYKYYLIDDNHVYREDWVEHNYNLFLKYHTFMYSPLLKLPSIKHKIHKPIRKIKNKNKNNNKKVNNIINKNTNFIIKKKLVHKKKNKPKQVLKQPQKQNNKKSRKYIVTKRPHKTIRMVNMARVNKKFRKLKK